ncbi:hypothetical protein AQUCO_02300177v1 [Aquilegia coerulea]|uniref:SIAH-type domain-containing protein n=1 Tax=Aquilegia coerulea TaxID=218851 RepID=A0A2G5DCG5_AQUCA|nr:hypothetical protein AQUCO_02300177v1 [Aquilegia coerulea]
MMYGDGMTKTIVSGNLNFIYGTPTFSDPQPLSCENGHIACSPGCTKLGNKCPSCSWPIGYNRCLAIEKVIESIKVSCEYKPYGSGETFSYRQKNTHEEKCIYAPCVCPISDCSFPWVNQTKVSPTSAANIGPLQDASSITAHFQLASVSGVIPCFSRRR